MVVNETFVKKRKMHKITLELNEFEYMRLTQAIDETSTFDGIRDLFIKAVDDAIDHKRTLDDCYNYGFKDIDLEWIFRRILKINDNIEDKESRSLKWHRCATMLKEAMCDMCTHFGLSDVDDIAHGTAVPSGLGLFDNMRLAYLSIMDGFRRFAGVADITNIGMNRAVPYMSLVDDIQKNFKNLLLNVNPTEDTEQFLEKQGIEESYEAMYDIILYMLTRITNNTKEYQSTSYLKNLITIYEMTGKTQINCLDRNESLSDGNFELYVQKAVTDMASGISHDGFDICKIIPAEILSGTSTTTISDTDDVYNKSVKKYMLRNISLVTGERELAKMGLNAIFGKALCEPDCGYAVNMLKPTSELLRLILEINSLRMETPTHWKDERKMLEKIIRNAACELYYEFYDKYICTKWHTDPTTNARISRIVKQCKPAKYKKWKKRKI